MSDTRWQRVWEIFHAAREAAPEERSALVEARCAGDEELRRDVLELLQHDRSRGVLEQEAAAALGTDVDRHETTREDLEAIAGEKIGEYRLLDKIGEGGMGVVYRAHDPRLQRTVALKFLSPDQTEDPEAAVRQLREARTAAALNHPNIATVYEIGESESGGFIAMEFVDGDLLRDRVRGAPLPVAVALDWALQLCEAISAAHELGIIHRDIKSSNVMITRDGRVKVLDFGVALHKVDTGRLTAEGMIVGTIDYLAPELLRGEAVTATSDVFSIGVVLYEMLGGQRPFRGATAARVLYQIVNEDPPPLTELRDDVSPDVATVVRRALAKDPSDRYESARALLVALRPIARAPEGTGATHAAAVAASVPGNLPVTTTAFIGRERELESLEARLEGNRLVTITGPGGAGKTRVSLELGRRARERFPMGVFFVELASLTEPAQVVRAVARVLGVREETGRDLVDSLVEHLASRKNTLLLLDNCEHLIEECAAIARTLLEAVPEIKIVATSQQKLGVPGEAVWQISTLSLPPAHVEGAQDLEESEAARLFAVRAAQTKNDFALDEQSAPVVAQICRRLDGIPLAIELAAARVGVLAVDKILGRLEDRFRLLTGGSRTSLPRQQTLRAAVEWSLDLLTEPELRLFLALSVFSDGLSLEAAEHVCEGVSEDEMVLDLLGRLVDKSLVMVRETGDGALRYHLLETLREYGSDGLRRGGDETEVRRRHAAFYLEEVERAEPELTGPDQARWLDRLDADAANVESGIRWLLANDAPDEAQRMAAAMWRFWFVRGHLGAGRELLGLTLDAVEGAPDVRARALDGAGVLANDQGDHEAARAHFEECLDIRRSLGDQAGEAQTLNSLGIAARDAGDWSRARSLLEQGLEINRTLGDRPGMAMSVHALGITAHREGNCNAARELFEEGLEIRRGLGDRRGIAALLAHLGSVDYDLGHHDQAKRLLEDALDIFRELENKRGITFALMYLGGVARRQGDLDTCWVHHAKGLTISRQLGDKHHLVQSLEWLAALAAAREDHARALELEGATAALREQFRSPRTPIEEETLREALAPSRAALGEDEAGRCRAAGREHTLDSVIPLALQRP